MTPFSAFLAIRNCLAILFSYVFFFFAGCTNLSSQPKALEWEALGYRSGTTAMPDSIEGRLAVLIGMRDYLTDPGKAVTAEDITFSANRKNNY
jgi:hypothetical protein